MNIPIETIAVITACLALLLAAYSLWQSNALNKFRKVFFAGTEAKDLEHVILRLQEQLAESQHRLGFLEENLNNLQHQATFSLQQIGLVRFNPFNDGGGNFSFVLALLDANDSGVLITSMYGREQNRIYTKKLDQGKSDVKLTDEEQQAVMLAHQKTKTPKPKH
jgi:hypothetical protein